MIELPDDLDITELDLTGKGLTGCPDLSRYTKLIKLDTFASTSIFED